MVEHHSMRNFHDTLLTCGDLPFLDRKLLMAPMRASPYWFAAFGL